MPVCRFSINEASHRMLSGIDAVSQTAEIGLRAASTASIRRCLHSSNYFPSSLFFECRISLVTFSLAVKVRFRRQKSVYIRCYYFGAQQ